MNQLELNRDIEQLIRRKDVNKESFSPDEIAYILQYEGSGGQGSKGAKGEGLLHEFFTPEEVVNQMWSLARKHGFQASDMVLEPSIGTGRMVKPAEDYSRVVGFEINPVSARICEIAYPGVKVFNNYFETAFLSPPRFTTPVKKTWLTGFPFGLVIGNPPYGVYQNKFSSYFDKRLFKQIEIFFIYQALQLLKPGGLLVFIVSSNFMRTGDKYQYAKDRISDLAELVDAYRLPSVFRFTEVPTDIIVLRRKNGKS